MNYVGHQTTLQEIPSTVIPKISQNVITNSLLNKMLNETKYKPCIPTDDEETTLKRERQTNIIVKIMEESLEKLKITLILSQTFGNLSSARPPLSDSEYKHCIKLIQEYIKERKMDNAIVSDPYLNYRLIKIIDFFHGNTQILKYFHDWINDINAFDETFIEEFKQLQIISEHRLRKSAISVLNREKRIHEVYHENEGLKKNIRVLQNLMKHRHISMKWKLAANEIIIQKLENDLITLKYENSILVKKEMINSRKSIKQIRATGLIKKKELEEELESLKTKYANLLKSNLKQQKIARDEKNKLLLQLQTLLKKFDETMIDKFKENLYLKDEFEKQKNKFETFMIEYKREEHEYDCIVQAKQEEEKRQQEDKILLFMMNRAACIIQKYWRKYMRRKKKGAKRGRKSKK